MYKHNFFPINQTSRPTLACRSPIPFFSYPDSISVLSSAHLEIRRPNKANHCGFTSVHAEFRGGCQRACGHPSPSPFPLPINPRRGSDATGPATDQRT